MNPFIVCCTCDQLPHNSLEISGSKDVSQPSADPYTACDRPCQKFTGRSLLKLVSSTACCHGPPDRARLGPRTRTWRSHSLLHKLQLSYQPLRSPLAMPARLLPGMCKRSGEVPPVRFSAAPLVKSSSFCSVLNQKPCRCSSGVSRMERIPSSQPLFVSSATLQAFRSKGPAHGCNGSWPSIILMADQCHSGGHEQSSLSSHCVHS